VENKPDPFSIDRAYVAGYARGLSWPDAWEVHAEPGGPWVNVAIYSGNPTIDAEREAAAELSRKENEAWRKGWAFGHHVKGEKKAKAA
jgi:hypothetical protein